MKRSIQEQHNRLLKAYLILDITKPIGQCILLQLVDSKTRLWFNLSSHPIPKVQPLKRLIILLLDTTEYEVILIDAYEWVALEDVLVFV